MQVAIMGAGMSGLSCAITLEKYGITPTVFEKRSCVGDRFVNGEAMFSILHRPVTDSISYIFEKFGIKLKPLATVNKLIIHSKNEIGTVDGELGYTNIRGRHEDSYENQLARQVKADIHFNSKYEYEELVKKFDYVILAAGDGEYASHQGNYNCSLTFTARGATVEGDFKLDEINIWFIYELMPKGYAFLIPYNRKEANLSISYPDYPNNIKLDIDVIWDRFFSLVCTQLNQNFKITDKYEITRYVLGICNKPKIDNTFYVGNCFGAISPGFGFGQFSSILTGVYAAWDLAGKGKYEDLTKPLFENYNHSLVLRRYLETLNDNRLDKLIKNIDRKLFSQLIDKVSGMDSGVQLLKLSTPILRSFAEDEK
jgi:flavin-dependent dehydrogenase